MPFGDAQSLKDDEVYSITAYVLHLNDLLKPEDELDAESLVKLRMPNRVGFVPDSRPDVKATLCMTNCAGKAEIHSEARKIDVTPGDERGRAPGAKSDGPPRPRVD
jgi:cytochrome c